MIVSDDCVLVISDLIPPHCAWGLRYFWRQHNLDFADFLQNGIGAKTLWDTGDSQARAAVTRKLEVQRGW
jgi:hypothetical protein